MQFNTKKFLILLVVFAMLISIQSISASDIADLNAINQGSLSTYDVDLDDNYQFQNLNDDLLSSGDEKDFEINIDFKDDIDYKENATFVVTVPSDANGDVNLNIQGKNLVPVYEGLNKVVDGKSNFVVPNLNAGSYNVNVRLVNDSIYSDTVVYSDTFTVNPIDTFISATCNPIVVGENAIIEVNLENDATGKIEVLVNGEILSGNVVNGISMINVSDLANGTYDAEIEYYNGINYNDNSTTVLIRVFKVFDYSIDIKYPENINAGDNVVIEFILPEDINGPVVAKFDGIAQNIVAVNGIANVTVNSIVKGIHLIEVNYDGNEKYISKSNSSELFAEAVDLDIAVENSTVKKNQSLVFNLPDDATGDLNVTFGNIIVSAPVINSKALISTNNVSAGVYNNVIVSYSGDNKYTSKNISLNNIKVQTDDYNILISAQNIYVGDVENISLVLPRDISGNVVVNVAGKNYNVAVSSGRGLLNINNLSSATYTINVTYNGDDKYLLKTNSSQFIVNKVTPTINIEKSTVIKGENFIFNLPADSTGNLNVKFSDITVSSSVVDSKAIISTENIPGGVYKNVIVSYSGDNKYTSFNAPFNMTIRHDSYDIIVLASDINVGDVENISLVLPSDISGNVVVNVAGKNYNVAVFNGKGSLNIQNLSYATYEVTATFAGNGVYLNNSNSTSFKVSVKTPVEIEVSDLIRGDNLTVDLPEDATGNVTVVIGNKTFVVPIVNGRINVPSDDLLPGNYTPIIYYPGDSKYSAFNITTKLEIKSRIIITANDLTKYYGNSTKFIVSVINSEGEVLNNYSLNVVINGKSYSRYTNANGIMSMNINLPSGVYNVSVNGENAHDNATITILSTVNGTDIIKVFRNATHYYATFRNSNGTYLPNGTEVEFNINGVFYKRYVSGDKGLAKLNINLGDGVYIITATNKVTGENCANNVTVLSKIQGNDLTKYFRNNTQYIVKLLSDDGKAVGAGKSITFNINGVFYTKTTNSTGHVKLNINLPPGDYIITGEYDGCKASHKIKVLPILTANDLTKKYGTSNPFIAHLVDGQGNPYSSQSVQFNINGVFYHRTTDTSGNARLNINLPSGQYIITSSYNGQNISNKVTVVA